MKHKKVHFKQDISSWHSKKTICMRPVNTNKWRYKYEHSFKPTGSNSDSIQKLFRQFAEVAPQKFYNKYKRRKHRKKRTLEDKLYYAFKKLNKQHKIKRANKDYRIGNDGDDKEDLHLIKVRGKIVNESLIYALKQKILLKEGQNFRFDEQYQEQFDKRYNHDYWDNEN